MPPILKSETTQPDNFDEVFGQFLVQQKELYYEQNDDEPIMSAQLPKFTSGTVTDLLALDRLRFQAPKPKWAQNLPSPPGGAVSFHPSLFTTVISADGTRQRRLSEVGIKNEEKENEDPNPREESSTQGEAQAGIASCGGRGIHIKRTPIKKEKEEEPDFNCAAAALKTPESTHKNIPLIDLTQSPPSPASSPFYKGSQVDFHLTNKEDDDEEEEHRADEPSTKRTRRYCDRRPA